MAQLTHRGIISVVIPTYNRANIVRKTLQGYAAQDRRDEIRELLVVDDGSSDNTRSVVEECCGRFTVPIRYLYQENSGLAAARNHAIREAGGELILFGDDDIVPNRSMVAEHLAGHRKYPESTVGILGHVAWAPEVRPTPFMEWAGLYGPQFHFGFFKRDVELDFRNAYFCNTSLKLEFLKDKGFFDENFRAYGWEDIEFSYRLYQSGWSLRYNPDAIGYHYKYETFDQSLRRMELVWQKSWPVYRETESGKRYLDLLRIQAAQPGSRSKGSFRKLVGRVKPALAQRLKPLMDSRLRLPARVYDFVWYHHCKPIMDAALAEDGSVGARVEVEAVRIER